MDTVELVPVVRPNGKTYRPRKPPRSVSAEDERTGESWVYVLGTHDVDLARRVANPVYSSYVIDPYTTWVRLTIRDGEWRYELDEVRGVPAVGFRESDDPEEG